MPGAPIVQAAGVNDGLLDLFFLDFHLSCGVIIAWLMRSKNQNAYPSQVRKPEIPGFERCRPALRQICRQRPSSSILVTPWR
jgi:hypothetical protein